MSLIPQSFIQELLSRVDIVELIGRYVQLKKTGINFSGLCPFHSEKSPSFSVSPSKQFFHCFGCGAHGSAVGFLMDYSGLTFVDAVKELAQSAGMEMPQRVTEVNASDHAVERSRIQRIQTLMEQANVFYRKQLRQSTLAIEYLKGRGLTGNIAARFALGYAPEGWENLEAVLGEYQNNEHIAIGLAAGLLIEREHDGREVKRHYDRFRHRIMFPIRNVRGQTVGFGGRVLDGGEPKYLNSPETALFSKGNELYGLFEARQAIREAGYVIVTEGYMDVVALAQLGFAQTVATLGTACTVQHVRKLFQQTDEVIFSFDGDAAGQRAARRALEIALPVLADNKRVRFLFLPKQHDPDSFIRELGAAAFEEKIASATPLSSYLVEILISDGDINTAEGKARILYSAKPLIHLMPRIVLRTQVLRNLAERMRLPLSEIEEACGISANQSRRRENVKKPARQAPTALEIQLLRMLLHWPSLVHEIPSETRHILRPLLEQDGLFTVMLDVGDALPEHASFAMFAEALRNKVTDSFLINELDALCASVAKDHYGDTQLNEARAFDIAHKDCQAALKKLQLDVLWQEKNTLIKRIESDANPEALEKFRSLQHKIHELSS
jgi:DNA primase